MNKLNQLFSVTVILTFAVLQGCRQEQKQGIINASTHNEQKTELAGKQINTGTLASKGIIKSCMDVPVYTKLSAQIIQLHIKEGMEVRKGQVLVQLDQEDIRSKIIQASTEFEQAKYKFDEILIGQGYNKAEMSKIPSNIILMAKIKSGYNISEQQYNVAQKQLAKTVVTAPISGIVSVVEVKPYDLPANGQLICRILDNKHLKVVFSILENEIQKISIGHIIEVTTISYAQETHKAKITSISPIVDKDGMIKIEAELSDNKNLLPGMTAIINM